MVICLERGADLHTAQLMPLPLTVSCSSKSRLVLPFWYRLTQVVLEKRPLNGCYCCCCYGQEFGVLFFDSQCSLKLYFLQHINTVFPGILSLKLFQNAPVGGQMLQTDRSVDTCRIPEDRALDAVFRHRYNKYRVSCGFDHATGYGKSMYQI